MGVFLIKQQDAALLKIHIISYEICQFKVRFEEQLI